MTRSTRLLDLIQALRRRRRPVAAARLAKDLGVSPRTIYRDIATLVAQGAPIEGEAGVGYVLGAGYLLPPLMFSRDEVDALVLGLRLVAQRGDPALAQGSLDALAKIVAVLPDEQADADRSSGLLVRSGAAVSPHLGAIRAALQTEHKLTLRYRDKQEAETNRTVWPVALGFFDGLEVLAAWCELRGGYRHFRLDRVAAVETLATVPPRRRRLLLAEWRRQEGIKPPD